MIYDRPYMREDYQPRQPPVLKWILLSTAAVFLLQILADRWFHQPLFFVEFFGLYTGGLGRGFLWTIVTYAFLHANFFHILGNMLVVFFMGRELLPLLGAKRFLQLYFVAAAAGGTIWLVITYLLGGGGPLVGASASAFALLIVFACIYPNKKITLLLYFIIPVSIKPKYIAYFAVGGTLFALFFFELPGLTQTAHSAHLGGIITGWLFYQYSFGSRRSRPRSKTTVELPAWFRKKSRTRQAPKFTVNISNRKALQAEVDRILDKINSKGFGSLSEEEKKILDRARDILSK